MKVEIYFDNVTRYEDKVLFDKSYKTMPLSRRQRIDKMKFDVDRRLSLGAGVLLDNALNELGIYDYEFVYTENGKPYLKDYSDKIKFSLSHSKDMVMCVLVYDENGNAPEVGCDIEFIKPINLKIAKRFFSEDEYSEIIESDDKDSAFFRLWTKKESFLKVTGHGMSIPLNSIKTVSDGNYEFFEIDKIDGYKSAYCLEVKHGKKEK